MIIEMLPGTDERMYALVAPLIMSVPIIRQNNNYPFKTSRKHLWFVALEDDVVIGFMPVERLAAEARIDNYYAVGDDPDLLTDLINRVKEEFAQECPLYAIVHARHADVFSSCGFTEVKRWKLYVKMECSTDECPQT